VGVADSLLARRGDDLARSSEVGEVSDGEDRAGSHGDSELGTSARVRGRETSGVKDSDRGSDAGADGKSSSRVRKTGRWANVEGEPA
jgi:hypothetical protein